jgi:hypothetical protein
MGKGEEHHAIHASGTRGMGLIDYCTRTENTQSLGQLASICAFAEQKYHTAAKDRIHNNLSEGEL